MEDQMVCASPGGLTGCLEIRGSCLKTKSHHVRTVRFLNRGGLTGPAMDTHQWNGIFLLREQRGKMDPERGAFTCDLSNEVRDAVDCIFDSSPN